MVRAQDTVYGGILYRSKLEASWAEFFDKNKIRHKYEPTRVDLGIDRYTPDFWLPDFSLWVEIKPYRHSKPHSKCYRLAIESRHHVLLIQGKPEQNVVDVFNSAVRRSFEFRTVVAEGEIKPSKEFFTFKGNFVDENALVLTNSSTDETVRFLREQ